MARRGDDLISGARRRPRPDDGEADERWARQRDDEIRADTGDVDAITDNLPPGSTMTRDDVAQIWQYPFEDGTCSTATATRPAAASTRTATSPRRGTGVRWSEAHGHANGVADGEQTRR